MRRFLLLLLTATLARAEGTSTTHIWSPVRAIAGKSTAWPGTDVMRCVAWVPDVGITNATQIGWFVTGGLGGGGLCSFTIYDASGTTLIATTGASDCSATGVNSSGVSAFSLTAGIKYQVCTCANTNGGSYLGTNSISGGLTTLQNQLSVPIGATAATGCTNGVAPSSTGVLSAAAVNAPILIISTSTP